MVFPSRLDLILTLGPGAEKEFAWPIPVSTGGTGGGANGAFEGGAGLATGAETTEGAAKQAGSISCASCPNAVLKVAYHFHFNAAQIFPLI